MKQKVCFTLVYALKLLTFIKCEEWSHHTVLDGNGKFHLYWKAPEFKYAESEIVFQAVVQAKGYVGFGLSPNGGMKGSDIVTGWIKDGQVYFQDRHGVGNTLPPIDDQQDWTLLDAKENDTHTTLKFSRKLDTCDEDDMIINDSTMRLIFAYSDTDPESEDPTYHLSNRGTKSALLLQSKVENAQVQDDPSLLYWDLKSPDLDISPYETVYWCKIFKSPELSKKHHITHVKPLIQEGNEAFVHHMVLYECVGGTDEEYAKYIDYQGHVCYHPNMPDSMKRCEGVSIAWAVGGDDLVYPDHVGLPLEPVPGKYFMLETHYDNPMLRQGIKDNSGLRIFYTSKLRTYDAGCLMLGSTVVPRMFIPPGQQSYELVGHSSTECLAPVMPKGGIKALGVLLHAHLLGRRLKVRHFREGIELEPLAVDDNYDFNYQEYRYFKEEIEILPTDQITVECTYNSSSRKETTFGGISTKEEMCLAFLTYYPRIDRFGSVSIPTFDTISNVLQKNIQDYNHVYSLKDYDWSKLDISNLQEQLKYSKHRSHCYFGDGEKNSMKNFISYPEGFQAFVGKESICKEKTTSRGSHTVLDLLAEASSLMLIISSIYHNANKLYL